MNIEKSHFQQCSKNRNMTLKSVLKVCLIYVTAIPCCNKCQRNEKCENDVCVCEKCYERNLYGVCEGKTNFFFCN